MAKLTEKFKNSIRSGVFGSKTETNTSPAKENTNAVIRIISKNFIMLPGIARDLNVTKRNIQKLVELEGGKPSLGPDAHFLKEEEREAKLEVELEKARPTPIKKSSTKIQKLKEKFSSGNILQSLKKFIQLGILFTFISYNFGEAIKDWSKGLWESIKQNFDDFVLDIREWFNEIVQPIIDEVKNFVEDWIIRPISGFFEKLGSFVKSYFEFWHGLITEPIETMKQTWEKFMSLVSAVKDKFFELKDKLVGFFGISETKEEKQARLARETKRAEVKKQEQLAKKAKDEVEEKRIRERAEKQKQEREKTKQQIQQERAGIGAAPTPVATEAPKTKVSPAETKSAKIGSETGKQAMLNEMNNAKITDPAARASIMAQVGHESGNFTRLSENLNYKSTTLMKLFPKKFAGAEDAQQVASGGPVKVAERIYGGRMGNAPEGSGEGFEYRGRGFIQLTGKQNYTRFGYASNPDELTNPRSAAESAIKYMMGYKGDWSNIKAVTKFVNGGYIGLEDRAKHFQEYLNDPLITNVGASTTSASGSSVSSSSAALASNQRQQAKSQTPVVINAPVTNNNVVNTTKVAGTQKSDTGQKVVFRSV